MIPWYLIQYWKIHTLTCRLVNRHAIVHMQLLGHNVTGCHQSMVRCLCFNVEHIRIQWILGQHHIKIVMINHVLSMTRKDLARSSYIHQQFYSFNTVWHQKTLKEGELETNLRCCFQSLARLHPLLRRQ
jgi:hypothetical protein